VKEAASYVLFVRMPRFWPPPNKSANLRQRGFSNGRGKAMARAIALSLALASFALPAVGEDNVDTATVTCREYFSGHDLMVAIENAFYQAAKGDPKLGSLSQQALADAIWEACTGKSDVKVIEALKQQ